MVHDLGARDNKGADLTATFAAALADNASIAAPSAAPSVGGRVKVVCTRVGAAASATRLGAPASGTPVAVPSSRFLSDGDDYCITFGAAAAASRFKIVDSM